jgi:energy-coupling factor transporter ATP-binding protein EcfA2
VIDSNSYVLEGADLSKDFVQGGVTLQVLRGAAIRVRAGERIAIVGASGSGKTTLLQLLGGLDLPTRGAVKIAGSAMNELSDQERGRLTQSSRGLRVSVPSPAAGVHGVGKRRDALVGEAHQAGRGQGGGGGHSVAGGIGGAARPSSLAIVRGRTPAGGRGARWSPGRSWCWRTSPREISTA